MPRDYTEAFNRVRGEFWDRGSLWRDLVREHEWRYRPADAREAVRRQIAWDALCGSFSADGVFVAQQAGRQWPEVLAEQLPELQQVADARFPGLRLETVEQGAEFLGRVLDQWCRVAPTRGAPLRLRPWNPPRRGHGQGFLWDEGPSPDVPPSVLDRLFAVLGALIRAFLEELDAIQFPEIPPPATRPPTVLIRRGADPGTGPPFGLPTGWGAASEGDSVNLTTSVGAGGSATVNSPTLLGPAVIERISMFSDSGFAGTVQLMVQGAGASPPAGAGVDEIFGHALLLGASNFGSAGRVMNWGPFARFAEWWPRRIVRLSPFRVVLTVTNSSAAARNFAAAVDRRDVEPVRA